jgi:N6-adenosine-specific RNA methylase IME4
MGDLPRIELFARQRVDGWDAWGNEVENDVDLSMPSHNPETVLKISEKEAQEGLSKLFG